MRHSIRRCVSGNAACRPIIWIDSWLRVSSAGSLKSRTFTLDDQPSAPANHEIGFNVLPQAATTLVVGVGSCLQWHGYPGAATIYANSSEAAQGLKFSLIR